MPDFRPRPELTDEALRSDIARLARTRFPGIAANVEHDIRSGALPDQVLAYVRGFGTAPTQGEQGGVTEIRESGELPFYQRLVALMVSCYLEAVDPDHRRAAVSWTPAERGMAELLLSWLEPELPD